MKIIRDVRVAEKIGAKSRTTAWRKAKADPDFPKPVSISPGITGWIESEIDEYIARKVAESRGAAPARKRAEHEVQAKIDAQRAAHGGAVVIAGVALGNTGHTGRMTKPAGGCDVV